MKANTWLLTLGLGLAMPVFGLTQTQGTSAKPMDHMAMLHGCPAMLPDVTLDVVDTATGIVVTFTAKGADVAELQRRVERLANMQQMMLQNPPMRERMVDGDVKYEALPQGARLTLTPRDPAKLEEFRMQVRVRLDEMRKGNCPMMENMMRAMTRKAPDEPAAAIEHDAHHPPATK